MPHAPSGKVRSAPTPKHILYFGHSGKQFNRLADAMAKATAKPSMGSGELRELELHDTPTTWAARMTRAAVVQHLRRHYVNLLVIDLRCADETQLPRRTADALGLLDTLDDVPDLEARYAFHRILALVSGTGPEQDRLVLALGARGVRQVLRQAHRRTAKGEELADEPALAAALLSRTREILLGRRAGKRALCAAGGGITGIFFEIGVLKCLDDCLAGNVINTFDMYFGISAGAVVLGLLSAGYSIDELMASVAGVPGGRVPPLDLRVLRLGRLDFRDLGHRAGRAAASGLKLALRSLRRLRPPPFDSLVYEYSDIVGPPFLTRAFERDLARVLSAPGATNDFQKLPHSLFIGTTDQDARQHTLFGDEQHADVPISVAIQASMSLNPAFSSTPISGRYYADGAITRTTNFVEAIRRRAKLIVVVDPFLPYVSREAGFSRRRGLLYNIDQDLRAVSYTRFEGTRNWTLRRHPEVSSYTFLPANRLRRLLSVNPMDHRPYLQIWRGAYLSTLQRVIALEHRMVGDFRIHGMTLDTERALTVAEQLEMVDVPQLADFYPHRRIEIRQPPLCLERGAG